MGVKSNSDKKLDLYAGTTILLLPVDDGTRVMYRNVDSDSIEITNGQIEFSHEALVGLIGEPKRYAKRFVRSNLPYIIEQTIDA